MLCTKTSPWNRRMGEVYHPDAVQVGPSWRCSHCGLLTKTKPYQTGHKALLPCAKCDGQAGWGVSEVNVSISCRKHCWSVVHFVEDEVAENEPQREALLNYWNELQQAYPIFKKLKTKWQEDTLLTSNEIISHPAYRDIIALGDVAVALILDDLRTNGVAHWFVALAEITGEDPIPKEHAGNLVEMAADWFHWAEKKTYKQAAYDKPMIDFA